MFGKQICLMRGYIKVAKIETTNKFILKKINKILISERALHIIKA